MNRERELLLIILFGFIVGIVLQGYFNRSLILSDSQEEEEQIVYYDW